MTNIDAIDALLPQTQCTRCGYVDCRAYAQAICADGAAINRCPPGGVEGITRLAAAIGRAPTEAEQALDPSCGSAGPRLLAVIDEAWCIGCTLCIKACPVDCIIGTHKRMHTVIEPQCTGCELCVPACPVDCISLIEATPGLSGWHAWSEADATLARQRYVARNERRASAKADHDATLADKAEHKLAHLDDLTRANTPAEIERKRSVIEAALARARAQRKPPTA
ncbi:MAG: RnfABCDGE type electron transport complex subunit B [Burkholderiales bacterium]|nr:RnfABCDGE type electron transport complex subunit B [Burkholderiales bacterium]